MTYRPSLSCYIAVVAVFQAKSCETTFERNILFNGPRAGINLNDGFGGGSKISQNLIFNFCRESGDHGPINSWNRQPYVHLSNNPQSVACGFCGMVADPLWL